MSAVEVVAGPLPPAALTALTLDGKPVEKKLLLTVEQAAAITGYSRALLYRAIKAGDLLAVRYGRTTRLRPQDLQAWIDAAVDGAA